MTQTLKQLKDELQVLQERISLLAPEAEQQALAVIRDDVRMYGFTVAQVFGMIRVKRPRRSREQIDADNAAAGK